MKPTQTERERTAALLVEQALNEVDKIVAANKSIYADVDTNPHRTSMDRRKFTLADAKPLARSAANLLREAWEILDPIDSSEECSLCGEDGGTTCGAPGCEY